MFVKYIKTTIKFLALSLLLQNFNSFSFAQVIKNLRLNEISEYKIGNDRSRLTEIQDLVTNSLNNPKQRASFETELLEFMKSDATFDSKQFVSRQLRVIGSEKSAIGLSELLKTGKLTDLILYALEEIEGEKVDDVLINALRTVSDEKKIGIINTLAYRKSKTAIRPITNLLKDDSSFLSEIVLKALGKIGDERCINGLSMAINYNNQQLRNTAFDSYLKCIDNMLEEGQNDIALKGYEDIYNYRDIPFSIKLASLVGIINSSENKSGELLSRIKKEPDELKFIPISKIREIEGDQNLKEFAKLLGTMKPANQIQLLSVMEDIGSPEIKPFILNILNSENEAVRIAAIKTIANIGNESEVITLAKIAADKSGKESEYASLSLDLLKGNKIDDVIISKLNSPDDNIKVELIKAVGNRNITSALSNIIDLTNSEQRSVKNQAFKTLGDIASEDNIPTLINILKKQNEKTDKRKVERTISDIIKKTESQGNISNQLLEFYISSADNDDKESTLRLLGLTGNKEAYKLLLREIENSDIDIKIAAITGLSNWPAPEPLNVLLNTAQNSNGKVQRTALKGFTGFISLDNNLSLNEKVELYKKSLTLAKTSNEKNIALDGIGHLDTFESLEVFKSYINQPDVKETVDDGINRVSWHLFPSNTDKVKKYVNYFLDNIQDERFQTKNTELLNAIDRFIERN